MLSAEIAILLLVSSEWSLMYNRKSVGPRMEPCGVPTLTGYSFENFPSNHHSNHSKSSFTKKWRNKAKYLN